MRSSVPEPSAAPRAPPACVVPPLVARHGWPVQRSHCPRCILLAGRGPALQVRDTCILISPDATAPPIWSLLLGRLGCGCLHVEVGLPTAARQCSATSCTTSYPGNAYISLHACMRTRVCNRTVIDEQCRSRVSGTMTFLSSPAVFAGTTVWCLLWYVRLAHWDREWGPQHAGRGERSRRGM